MKKNKILLKNQLLIIAFNEEEYYGNWWIRTPSARKTNYGNDAMFVSNGGSIYPRFTPTTYTTGVRPVIEIAF